MPRFWTLLILGFVIVCAALGAEAWQMHAKSAAACTSVEALDKLHRVLRARYGLDSTFINDVKTASGGFFATRQHCTAQIAEIRDNVNAEDMAWRALDYVIVRDGASSGSVVTAELGGPMKLNVPPPSFWRVLTTGHW
jgi:hypothetical protein